MNVLLNEIFSGNHATNDISVWMKNNPVTSNYNDDLMLPIILDRDGLIKIKPNFVGYMLSPTWSNGVYQLEAVTRIAESFEDLTDELEKQSKDSLGLFLYKFYYVPAYPMHMIVDPITFEITRLDRVQMSPRPHWRIRYAELHVKQPKGENNDKYTRTDEGTLGNILS